MSLEEVAMMGEALSGLAVFVSLIYLIFELKRTNKSVRVLSSAFILSLSVVTFDIR